MKKVFLLGAMVCALGMMTACKSGTANETSADTIQPTNETAIDTIHPTNEDVATGQSSETGYGSVWDELERLTNKISDGDTLVPEEWAFFFDNIDVFDGYLAEGIGYVLYNILESDGYCENIEPNLRALTPEKREHVLDRMIGLMSIDIMLEEHTYTWDEFTTRFVIFRGSKAAEKHLKEINEEREMENQ